MNVGSLFKVIENRDLTHNAYILKFERKNIQFKEGQYLLLSTENSETREYSIYSGINDDFLEVIILEVECGNVSKKLRNLKKGDNILAEGSFGYFLLEDLNLKRNKLHYFIATGTGISPFHSFVKSCSNLNYKLIHGIRDKSEKYEADHYSSYISCISRNDDGDFKGRVTDYLSLDKIDITNTVFYLCGNSDMIYDAFNILKEKGVTSNNIKIEAYF